MILELMDRPIAFQRTFVRLGCGITGALMLSQAVYWSKRTKSADAWFFKTQEEWEEETGLTRREQETARKKLRALGVLEEKKQGIPCRTFYRVNAEVLQNRLESLHKSCNTVCRNPPNSTGVFVQSNTETTTEITTETTKDIKERSTKPQQLDLEQSQLSASCDAARVFDDAFEIFWVAGMRKQGKKQALTEFKRACKKAKLDPASFAKMLVDDIKARIERQQMGFDKLLPATYLRNERWTDELVDERKPQIQVSKSNAGGYIHDFSSMDYGPSMTEDDMPDWARD